MQAETLPPALPTTDEMYTALVNKDSTFEGIFIVGVKTTGIFCRPTCTARKPLRKNVEFFGTNKEALSFGYRACKVCRPMERAGETPAWIKTLMDEISATPDIRLRDRDLRSRDVDPTRLRRWFKKNHGMTFQAYLRAFRVNHAFGLIRHQNNVTETAFESGYDSLSGFSQAYKQIAGFNPSESKFKNIVTVTRILTPLGPLFAGATDDGLCLLEFTDRRMLETQLSRLRKRLKANIIPGNHPLFARLDQQLTEYFAGRRKEFDIPLVTPGTDFQQQVWAALMTIPAGETRSYQQQAEAIGNPKAVRAVAKANGDNRISILIPCHRVIGKNGKLTGYGGGLWRKQRLLDLEK